jgi:hypothetical protein
MIPSLILSFSHSLSTLSSSSPPRTQSLLSPDAFYTSRMNFARSLSCPYWHVSHAQLPPSLLPLGGPVDPPFHSISIQFSSSLDRFDFHFDSFFFRKCHIVLDLFFLFFLLLPLFWIPRVNLLLLSLSSLFSTCLFSDAFLSFLRSCSFSKSPTMFLEPSLCLLLTCRSKFSSMLASFRSRSQSSQSNNVFSLNGHLVFSDHPAQLYQVDSFRDAPLDLSFLSLNFRFGRVVLLPQLTNTFLFLS